MTRLKLKLPPKLYEHCAGVADTAVKLAKLLGVDEEKASLAGWLHDCARDYTTADLLAFARIHGIEADKYALAQPILLHGPVGAVLAQTWGISDSEVLSAIRNHTLGYPGISLLEQIIYVADKIEPNRNYPGIDELRTLTYSDFQSGLLHAVSQSIVYVLEKKQIVHPLTVTFWNWLVEGPIGECKA